MQMTEHRYFTIEEHLERAKDFMLEFLHKAQDAQLEGDAAWADLLNTKAAHWASIYLACKDISNDTQG